MPQLQKGQLQPGQNGAPKLYGVDKVENTIPFQQRLFERFKPAEYVTVKNITGEAIYWQYMPQDGEEIQFSEDGYQRQIYRQEPEMWMIEAGQTEALVGASAYLALDTMYKKWAADSILKRFKDPSSPNYDERGQHLPKNFNYADAGMQEDFINQAYLGKATLAFNTSEGEETPPPAPAAEPPRNTLDTQTYATPDNASSDNAPSAKKVLANAGKK